MDTNNLELLTSETSLVVVDSNIEGYEDLVKGVLPNTEILILDQESDGIAQITEALNSYETVNSIHIVSHGSNGTLYLGDNAINSNNINTYKDEFSDWNQYLTGDADVMVYGCNVAQDSQGQDFINSLSQFTGADVAASTNITGNNFTGGDWNLETSTGAIEANFPLQLDKITNFDSTLLPPGFQNELVLEGVSQPIALENLPDGSMIVAFRDGPIKRFEPNSSQPILEDYLTVNNTFKAKETGLMDIRFDASEGYLYTYYSSAVTDKATISRWNMSVSNPTEEIIWEDVSPLNGAVYHIGGSIDIGPDDKVWLTIGDKFKQSTSPDLSLHNGKIVRINKDGSIPDGTDGSIANPYAIDNDETTLPDIWASGLRNPFRARWDLESDRFFIGDVGGNDNFGADASWEEINIATLNDGGASYGWPEYEGPATSNDPATAANYKDPFFSWQHDEAGSAIIGGLVYRGTQFPEEYQGAYFFANYVDENIQYLTFDQNGDVVGGDTFYNTASGGSGLGNDFIFDTDVGAVSEFEVGADGALYYLDLSRRGDEQGNGTIRRIAYVGGGNTAPNITAFSASSTSGSAPLTVDFSVTATDLEGDSLLYKWDLDGDPTTGSSFAGVDGLWEDVTSTETTTYTYNNSGSYSPVVFVSDGQLSDRSDDQFPTPIQVGSPPTVSITAPAEGFSFQAGEVVNLSATATDGEDGDLTGTSIVWDTVLFHNDHEHPDPGAYTGTGPSFQVETSGHDYFGDVTLTVVVTATDSDGLTATDSITLTPDESVITFNSSVLETNTSLPGADNPIKLDALPLVEEPFLYDNIIGFQNTLEAEVEVIRDNNRYEFVGWSDGVTDAVRSYTIPETDTTLTANYTLVETLPDDNSTGVPVRDGLVLELDAGRGVTTNGDTVTAWADQSGAGNDLTASGDPQLATEALNGQNVIKFDTNSDKLDRVLEPLNNLPAGDSQRTVFMVAKYNENGYGGFGYGNTSSNQAFGLNVDAEGELMVQGWSGADMLTNTLGTGQGWLTQSAIVAANPSGSAKELVTHYKNGVLIDSQERNFNTVLETIVVGSNLKGRNSLDMEVAEILVYDRAFTDEERQQVENYLQQKYGVDTNTSTNQSPTAQTDSYIVPENSLGSTLDVLLNDDDPEGEAITLDSFTQPANGVVTLDDNGTPDDATDDQLIYEPTVNTSGSDSFTYDISDSSGNSATGTVNITVEEVVDPPSNLAPNAVDDTFTVVGNGETNTLNLLANDTDADIDTTPGSMDFSTYEVLVASPTSLRTNQFRHLVSGGGLDTVPFVFDASPAGGDDPHFHMMGSRQEDFLTQHNTGGNGETIDFTFSREDNEAFAFEGFSYTSGLFFPGSNAEFTVVGTLASGGTISQTFAPATDEQVFQTATLEGAGWRNVTSVSFVGSLAASGTEPTQELNVDDLIIGEAVPLTITSVGTAINGTVALDQSGYGVVYTPTSNTAATDQFSYTINDGQGGTDTAEVTVNITSTSTEPTNTSPIAEADNLSTEVNTPLTFTTEDLLVNDSDPDDDVLIIDNITLAPEASGTLIANQDGTYTYTPALDFDGTDTINYTVSDGNGGTDTAELIVSVTTTPVSVDSFFISLDSNQTINGTEFQKQDILEFNGTDFSLLFDASDIGLGSKIEGFDVISDTEILMSFNNTFELAGVGTIGDGDVVKFTATSLGTDTQGTFSMYFDGSVAGLSAGIDGLSQLADGSLLISTDAKTNITELGVVRDEDVLQFTPTVAGDYTNGIWSMYVDGGEVNLGAGSENVDAIAIDENGDLLLSTVGDFDVTDVAGADEDVFVYTPTTSTTGSYSPELFFDGSLFSLIDISGIDKKIS